METSPTADRPRQVTVAGWVGVGASLAMLLSVFSWMSKLTTVEVRESLQAFLAKGSGKALGIDLHQALVLARVGLFVTGAAAAAMVVLAVFAMRRDKTSRVVMSVLALPILVCGVFVDPFLAGFMVCAVVLLWTRPASDWFLRRAPRPEPSASIGTFGSPPSRLPPQLPAHPVTAPLPPSVPPTGAPGAPPVAPPRLPRPTTVFSGCVTAGFFSSFTAVLLAVVVVALPSISRAKEIRTELEKQPAFTEAGLTLHELVQLMQVLVGLATLWALSGAVLAALTLRGHAWARVVLIVSSVAAGLLSVLAAVSFPPLLVLTAACVAVPVLLLRPDASRWYADQSMVRSRRPPPYRPERPW